MRWPVKRAFSWLSDRRLFSIRHCVNLIIRSTRALKGFRLSAAISLDLNILPPRDSQIASHTVRPDLLKILNCTSLLLVPGTINPNGWLLSEWTVHRESHGALRTKPICTKFFWLLHTILLHIVWQQVAAKREREREREKERKGGSAHFIMIFRMQTDESVFDWYFKYPFQSEKSDLACDSRSKMIDSERI